MQPQVPDWLEDFQRQFSEILRTPLDTSSRQLRARKNEYHSTFCQGVLPRPKIKAPEHLAIYNCQYWFRLFAVLQNEFPLTARLLGYWQFNQMAQDFLVQKPPQQVDIAQAGSGFVEFVKTRPVMKPALKQAVQIDQAWNKIFSAPDEKPWRFDSSLGDRWSSLQLIPREAMAFISEDWPLMQMRAQSLRDPGEGALKLPHRLSKTQWWCIIRFAENYAEIPLEPLQTILYDRLTKMPIAEALGTLEQELSLGDANILISNTQRWLSQSMQWDMWVGVREWKQKTTQRR